MVDDRWDCEAYGPEGIDVGALCFLAEQGHRACSSKVECRIVMAGQRQLIFNRIQALAAAGDTAFTRLAREITSPDELFRGAD